MPIKTKKKKVLVNTDKQYSTQRDGRRSKKTVSYTDSSTNKSDNWSKSKTKTFKKGRKAGTTKQVDKKTSTNYDSNGKPTSSLRTRKKSKK